MGLLGAVLILIVCLAGGFAAMIKWFRTRRKGILALWISLHGAAVISAIYTALTLILVSAVQ